MALHSQAQPTFRANENAAENNVPRNPISNHIGLTSLQA